MSHSKSRCLLILTEVDVKPKKNKSTLGLYPSFARSVLAQTGRFGTVSWCLGGQRLAADLFLWLLWPQFIWFKSWISLHLTLLIANLSSPET
jgi:hypothetical protein